jgi:cystathionine gamma-synthase
MSNERRGRGSSGTRSSSKTGKPKKGRAAGSRAGTRSGDEPSERLDLSASHGPSTRAVRGGEDKFKSEDALTTPIFQTSTYIFRDSAEIQAYNAGELDRFEYGRYGNPTQRAAERKLAVLERAEDALLFPSGMNALGCTLLALLRAGDHAILTEDCYKNTRRFCEDVLRKFGVEFSFVRAGDPSELEAAVRPRTRVIVVESPTNPHLRVADLPRTLALARAAGAELVLDSTLATPYNQRPFEHGVRYIVHSVTKYLNGHQDLLAGALVGGATQVQAVRKFCRPIGGIADPHQSWLILRGLKTFALRMERHNRNAQAIAEFLEAHPRVQRVWYPGLRSHPDHAIAACQMEGFGGIVSFEVDGDLGLTLKFVDALDLWLLGPSMGGVESLASHPATVSYSDFSPQERARLGIHDNFIRLAVGIEDADDLIADLERALSCV